MGSWKNIIEMEKAMTMEEVNLLAKTERERVYAQQKFMAALKGVDLDEASQGDNPFDRVKMKAEAELHGKSEERYILEDVVGIDFETDGD